MHTRTRGGTLISLLAFSLLLAGRGTAFAQDEGAASNNRQESAAKSEINFEVQLHTLITAEGAEGAAKVPQALDAVVRELKAMLPPSEYRLATTFVGRVTNNGSLEMRSVAASPFGPQLGGAAPPTFFQFTIGRLLLADDASGEKFVRVQPFRFGLRVPIQVTSAPADKGAVVYPAVQYEDVGLTTQVSVREGEPTLVGTLNSSRPGQLFVLVLTVRRVGK
jgi:hypothetical protein